MLQSFNDRLKGPFTWIIVISVSAVFVLTGSSFLFNGAGSKAEVVAKVGDYEITARQFEQYVQQDSTTEYKKMVLDSLINQYLMMSATNSENLTVSKLSLQEAIFTNPAFQDDNGKFSNQKLQATASYMGGIQNIEQIIGQNILSTIIPNNINNTGFVTDTETTDLANIYSQQKTIEYFKISPNSVESEVVINDNNLQNYFDDNKAEYVIPASTTIEYYSVSKDSLVAKQKISESDIKSYYGDNSSLFDGYTDKTKASIKKILENRMALAEYNSLIGNIDVQKFATLKKDFGNAKTITIINNSDSNISGVTNSRFFNDNNKYAALNISDDSSIIYYVVSKTSSSQQNLKDVKDKVTKSYKDLESKKIAKEDTSKAINDLESNKKVDYKFIKLTISSDTKNINTGFKQYVLDNGNNIYDVYTDNDGINYVYKVLKVESINPNSKDIPINMRNIYSNAELPYYTNLLKNDTTIKINSKNI